MTHQKLFYWHLLHVLSVHVLCLNIHLNMQQSVGNLESLWCWHQLHFLTVHVLSRCPLEQASISGHLSETMIFAFAPWLNSSRTIYKRPFEQATIRGELLETMILTSALCFSNSRTKSKCPFVHATIGVTYQKL